MTLEEITGFLKTKNTRLDSDTIKDGLSELKTTAVSAGNEPLANDIWFYETVLKIQSEFLSVYSLLKKDEDKAYDSAWCLLEQIEIALGSIRDNFPERVKDCNLEFIEKVIFNLQKLFPYRLFMSREMVVKSSECSICHTKTSIRNPCPHKVGKLYNGEICCTVITGMEFLSMHIVTDPFDKFCVPHMEGVKYNYSLLKKLMEAWDNPYDNWYVEILRIKDPRFKDISRNSQCPCGSGKKYKRCCLGTDKECMDHFRITFNNKSFAETPVEIMRTTVTSG